MKTKLNLHENKKVLFFLFFTYLSMNFAYTQTPTMFLYETDEGYTYVDKDFKPLMNKTFKWAGRFFEGLAVASENGYVGYINTKGKFTIKPEFEYALPFHHGIAKVWKDGKPYIIDKKGKILFEHNYLFIKYAVKDSFEPIFIVTTQYHRKKGIIDKRGKIIADTIYNDIRQFSEGLAVAQKDGNWGVINLQGEIIVPFDGKYLEIGDFHLSRAAVTSREWDRRTIGFIDNKGNFVFKVENCDIYYIDRFIFYDGLICLQSTDNTYRIFDIFGNKVYENKNYVHLLGNGYMYINYSLLDNQGEIILQKFNSGLQKAIKINSEIYFINSFGKLINLQGEIDKDIDAKNVFVKGRKYGDNDYFINKDLLLISRKGGIYAIWYYNSDYYPPYEKSQFTFIDPEGFKDGLLYVIFYDRVGSNLRWGYINERKEIVYRNHTYNYFLNNAVKPSINYKEENGCVAILGEDKKQTQKLNESVRPNNLSFVLDSSEYEKYLEYEEPPKRLYHRFRIINETTDTLLMKYCNVIVQVKDIKGNWREIHYTTPNDVITEYDMNDGDHKGLIPNEHIEYAVKSYSGGFRTKMRICVKIPAIKIWNKEEKKYNNLTEDKVFYSNEIDFEVNASQFVRSGFTKDGTEGYPFEDYVFDRIRTVP